MPTQTGQALKDAKEFGWEVPDHVNHSWTTMIEAIQNHIGSLNFGYRVALKNKGVKYINALAQLQDAHTIKVRREGREEERKRGEGGRKGGREGGRKEEGGKEGGRKKGRGKEGI